jgi:hypothetical protein
MFTAAFSLKSIILFLQSNFNAQSSFFAFYDAPLKRQKRRPLRVPSRQHCHGHHPNHGDPEMKNLLTYRYRQRSAISFFNYIISISWPNWYSKYQLVVEVYHPRRGTRPRLEVGGPPYGLATTAS